ncbi:cytosine/adenosine deaminase-related metal-dependent hydrolase [Tamaricihabitans halophyticus]|uniref:Cytosine/adenosine deaminase-related metal-dependent hydrolase n=1 Tax=Tamaricihabitans halophyticus TaxID=1262583 RepID=A0A4R2Q0R9_9PSEU|nr:amidohydrolase family protein [Tamaricihabitans halophyticus]TCP42070.1 cytosine/adenosine deaminase-related metal-dependent hydrolase [Tamaricihabitans halophyticus]
MTSAIEYTAPWIIAFQDGEHRLLRNGAVVVDQDRIVHVGAPGAMRVDRTEHTDNIIAPGFISLHTHMQESPVDKGIAEDIEKRQFWSTNLIEILPPRAKALTTEDAHICARVSIAEHLRTGTTTVMQMGVESDAIAELCETVGLRAFIAESYRSGEWFTDNGKTVDYRWFDDDGQAAFDRALVFAKRHRNRSGDALVTGFLNPSQVDTCSANLLRKTRTAADEYGLLMQIHAAQSYSEFHEMTRRHGRTPIEWLDDVGFLGERTLIGHGLFLTGTSWTNFHGDDLGLLARSGTTVVYNPWVFARNGIIMESYDRYRANGVEVCFGTDTTTQSMLWSLRWASIITKVFEHRADVAKARDVFDAATVRAADVLERSDLGRIEVGAKADMVFWKSRTLFTTPTRDPIRTIVYYAEHEDIERVMVDGRFSLENGAVCRLDEAADLRELQEVSERVWAGWPRYDWANRTMNAHVPMSYPEFEERS